MTRYQNYDSEGKNRFWQWFTPEHKQEMSKLIFDMANNHWALGSNDLLKKVLKTMMDLSLMEDNLEETEEAICIISGIQIVDAFWKTMRMSGVPGDLICYHKGINTDAQCHWG